MMNNHKTGKHWVLEACRGQIMPFGSISGLERSHITEAYLVSFAAVASGGTAWKNLKMALSFITVKMPLNCEF